MRHEGAAPQPGALPQAPLKAHSQQRSQPGQLQAGSLCAAAGCSPPKGACASASACAWGGAPSQQPPHCLLQGGPRGGLAQRQQRGQHVGVPKANGAVGLRHVRQQVGQREQHLCQGLLCGCRGAGCCQVVCVAQRGWWGGVVGGGPSCASASGAGQGHGSIHQRQGSLHPASVHEERQLVLH